MIVLDANLWDLSAEMDMAASFDRLGEAMLTDDTEHAYDILMEFTSKEQVDRRYGSGGVDSIFDGVIGTPDRCLSLCQRPLDRVMMWSSRLNGTDLGPGSGGRTNTVGVLPEIRRSSRDGWRRGDFRYIRLVITNPGGLPTEHPNKWAGSWIFFFDELTVEGLVPEGRPSYTIRLMSGSARGQRKHYGRRHRPPQR